MLLWLGLHMVTCTLLVRYLVRNILDIVYGLWRPIFIRVVRIKRHTIVVYLVIKYSISVVQILLVMIMKCYIFPRIDIRPLAFSVITITIIVFAVKTIFIITP